MPQHTLMLHRPAHLALAVAAITATVLALAALAAPIGQLTWLLCGVTVVLTIAFGRTLRQALILALVPATLLTNSAIVPFSGRYVPALTVMAAVAGTSLGRTGPVRARLARFPRALLLVLGLYLAWMVVTTLTSTERLVSAEYVVGSVGSLVLTMLLIPADDEPDLLVRRLLETLVITGVAMLLSGLALLGFHSVTLFGRTVGLYFFEEVTLFGHPTHVVFPQDYGPFVGPETAPLALGIPAAMFLAHETRSRARGAWWAAAAFLAAGLAASFSREGWLITAIACGAMFVASLSTHRAQRGMAAMMLVMLVLFVGGVSNRIGVLGRMDVVRAWYGADAPAILLNPDLHSRGKAPAGSAESTTAAVTSGGANSDPGAGTAVAVPPIPPAPEPPEASPPATTSATVELKGFSSVFARFSLWRAAIAAAERRPWLGYGIGTDADAIVPYLTGADARLRGATTHSTFLRILVEMGVPGLAIYLLIYLIGCMIALRHLIRAVYDASALFAASILAFSASQFTGTLLLGGASFPGFWLALALGLVAAGSASSSGAVIVGHIQPALRRQRPRSPAGMPSS